MHLIEHNTFEQIKEIIESNNIILQYNEILFELLNLFTQIVTRIE